MDSSSEFADYSEEGLGSHHLLQQQPASTAPGRAAPFSAMIGLVFIVVAVMALIDALWIRIDVILIVGGMVAASGVAMFAAVSIRHRRRSKKRF